jgi:hypothetical protein
VRQLSIADITLNWPRLTWPALALRQAGPWSRKMSAISRNPANRCPDPRKNQAIRAVGPEDRLLFSLAKQPQNRAGPHVKIGRDPAQPQAVSAGSPNCGYLRCIGFLKALAPERSAL